jgi:hypothetical protein
MSLIRCIHIRLLRALFRTIFPICRYSKLADRFVGVLPPGSKLGTASAIPGATKREAMDTGPSVACTLSKTEVEKLIKARLRSCWWGPRSEDKCSFGGRSAGAEMNFARDIRPWEEKADMPSKKTD